MNIVDGRSHHHELWAAQGSLVDKFCSDSLLIFKQVLVLIHGELIVAEFVVNFVIASVIKAAKHHSEENAHIRMIMQGHPSTLLDKEQDESVIIAALDRYPVKIRLEMIRVILALNPELFQVHFIHQLHQLLAPRIIISVV